MLVQEASSHKVHRSGLHKKTARGSIDGRPADLPNHAAGTLTIKAIMAYFANSSEGIRNRIDYCDRCAHDEDENGCPVEFLHLSWNYDAAGVDADETKRTALNTLWPRSADGCRNLACRMFVDAATIK